MRIKSVSHATFAAVMIAFGILGPIREDLTIIWEPVPKAIPARKALVYLCAVLLVGWCSTHTASVSAGDFDPCHRTSRMAGLTISDSNAYLV